MTTKTLAVMMAAVMMALAGLADALTPGQFDAEIEDTLAKVQANPSNLTLAIITDVHYDPSLDEPSTLEPTMEVLSRILAGTEGKIDALWNLGDFINGNNTGKQAAKEQIRTVVDAQTAVTVHNHNIAGNHDSNLRSTLSDPPFPTTEILSATELNELLENRATVQAEQHNPKRRTDYYVDYPGIRAVCLSASETMFTNETVNWLRDTALNTRSEVLILAHIPTRPEWGFQNDIVSGEKIEQVIRDFIARGGTVIGYIHGHDHGDMINEVTDEEGNLLWTEVAIGCTRFQEPTGNGTPGMTYQPRNEKDATMLLFDIVSVDRESRTVRFTRFGAGEDREIHY